jgi:hypothetical protein
MSQSEQVSTNQSPIQSNSNINLSNELSQTDAIKVLIRAAQVAQEKGAYSLQEASLIHQAVSTFMVSTDDTDKTNEEVKEQVINNTNNVTSQ